jgi:hypothetical protein
VVEIDPDGAAPEETKNSLDLLKTPLKATSTVASIIKLGGSAYESPTSLEGRSAPERVKPNEAESAEAGNSFVDKNRFVAVATADIRKSTVTWAVADV